LAADIGLHLAPEVAGSEVAAFDLPEERNLGLAAVLHIRAARVKPTSRGRMLRTRNLAREQQRGGFVPSARIWVRNGSKKCAGVGMSGLVEDAVCRT